MTAVPRKILLNLVDSSAEPLLLAQVDRADWPVSLANSAFGLLDTDVESIGQPFADVMERLVGRELAREVSETVRSGQASTIPVETRGGEFLLVLEPIDDAGVKGNFISARWRSADARSISSRVGEAQQALTKANRRIRDLTREDPVTGLLNDAAFRDVLHHDWAVAAREKSSLAIAAFGFDDFGAYLDVFGRHATDSCLRRVAQVIRRALRRASDVAARIDGDDGGRIVVLSHGSDVSSVRSFALGIAAAVRELGLHHPRSRVSRFVTVSFDIAMLRADDRGKSANRQLDDLLAQ